MATVLITGASSGIGLAAAKYLAEKGYRVFGTTRSLEKRAGVISELREKYGDNIEFIAMDVTQEETVQTAVREITQKVGSIDNLVCNAGNGIYGSIEEMPMELVYKQFDTNVFGYLRVLRAVLPAMRERRSGRVVLISSMAGIVAIPFQAHYSASKYAIEALTQGLRQELRGFGVKVAAIRPGDIKTDFNDVTDRYLPEQSRYKKWSEACGAAIDKNIKAAPPPVLVAKKIYKILKTNNPKAYYSAADLLTSLLPILTPFMTSGLKEKVIRLFYGTDFL